MKLKRIIPLLLVLCLVFNVLTPAADALSLGAGKDTVTSGKPGTTGKGDGLVSGSDKLGLRLDKDKLTYKDGQWLVTGADGTMSVAKDAQLPEYIQELREAAEHYEADDIVPVFVVLEDAPLAELGGLSADALSVQANRLSAQQDTLLAQIRKTTGAQVNVLRRFTKLTNSVVIETTFGSLEAIAALKGVKSVFISPMYYPCETSDTFMPNSSSAGEMSGLPTVWQELGFTGKGMTVAVLDTGLDLDHPSFAAAPEGAAWDKDYVQKMLDEYELNAEELYKGTLTADHVFSSEKVPFIFNYSSKNTNVLHGDGLGDHGTHVAGIIAANEVEGSGVIGMAPDAQIIVMKVFNSQTGASSMYDLVAALEDCMTMGIDVVNMSLGSAAGFASANDEEIDAIFRRIAESDIVVDVAAGNDGHSMSGSLYGNYKNPTNYIDNATVAAPSTYTNSMSIASVNNATVYSAYFTLADGTPIHYMQPVEYLYGQVDWSLEILAGKNLEYVILDGVGDYDEFYDEDYNSLVEGKVVVIPRGTLSFAEKALNAQDAGAAAVLIWDNVDEYIFDFGMTMTYTDEFTGDTYYPEIPAVLISLEAGQTMADAQEKTMQPKSDLYPRKDAYGGQMSSFSGWGVAPELRLLPELTGVGGNVYSSLDGGNYGIMSGTSMATPQVAGVTAVVLQYLKETYVDATDAEIRAIVNALLMSTAVPVIDNNTGLEASPRQQGAGLVNGLNAITANAYLSVPGSTRAKAELGDNAEGKFTFTFTVHNLSDTEKTYRLSASLLCEDYVTDDNFPGEYFIAGQEHKLDESVVRFSKDTVTVAANSTADITVTIELSNEDKDWIEKYFPCGNYVEGFVYLTPTDENDVTLSMPYLGFYKDWQESPIFDTGYWWNNGFWGYETNGIEAVQYYHSLFVSLGSGSTDWVLGFNPYADMPIDENGDIEYDPAHNVISPNGDGVLDNISDYYLSMLRNVKWLRLTYRDENGNVLSNEILDYISKTMYNSNYGGTVPFVYSWSYDNLYDFTDKYGNPLPDGTKLTLTISAILAYDDDSHGELTEEADDVMLEIPITIDTVAPELVGAPVEYTKDGRNYMTLTVRDANPACVALMNRSGSVTYAKYSDRDMTQNDDGTYSIDVDITGLGDRFTVALCDYGCNEAYFNVEWSQSGTNNPEVDEDGLYAFRVYDLYVAYYQGYDLMYGWGTLDKASGLYTEQRSDAYEYYALNAAEYAGGYVFAVDAGNNFVRMQPGLWNREWICNLGVHALDMAFDATTGTMYLTTKTTDEYEDTYYVLYTVDLLTGELTELAEYDSEYDMPWAMTFVGDKLYAVKKYYSGIFEVNLESYELEQVTNADGEKITFLDDTGKANSAGYSQSMTYSAADGKLYWAYYRADGTSYGFFVIDPTDWSYTFQPYSYQQEYVGLLTLESGNYTLPESDEVTGIALSKTELILRPGASETLTASALPWNAKAGDELVWESDAPYVATVNNGKVTAVSAGMAEITVSCGDVSVSCTVQVVDVHGTMYGYNLYSNDSTAMNWIGLDLEDMNAKNLGAFDVELVAGDYNGHDGCYYGFDVAGQCYRYDPNSGSLTTLGEATGKLVADMAYDYARGYLYALVYDAGAWTTTLYLVDMATGALVEYALAYDVYLTLAADMYGNLFAINTDGVLFMMMVTDDPNGGIAPIGEFDDDEAQLLYIYAEPILETQISLAYQQSMCYDHNNDVILWSCPDQGTVYWIDLYNGEMPYLVDLGAPNGLTEFQYLGTFVLPEEIYPLEFVPVDYVAADDLSMLLGTVKQPTLTIRPLNATNRDVTYVSENESIVKVVDGKLVAVGVGTTTVTGTLVDYDPDFDDEYTYEFSFTVSVKNRTDNLVGYLLYDAYDGSSSQMLKLDVTNPSSYDMLSYVADIEGRYFLLYAGDYVASENVIYAYGYEIDNTSATWCFLTIDPSDWQITKVIDLGKEFTTAVYDMAFDYATGTMYAVATPSGSASSNLYYVDLASGRLITCLETDYMMTGLVATREGTLYTLCASGTEGLETASLWRLNREEETLDFVLDTGVKSNMIAPMTYDFDNDYLYWNAVYQLSSESNLETGLYLIDLSDESLCKLGMIGSAGAQMSAMLCLGKDYPEVQDKLGEVLLGSETLELSAGETAFLDLFAMPYDMLGKAEITWTSEDETIASVDTDGCIHALAAGKTSVTVRVSYDGVVIERECTVLVYGEQDYLISYDRTAMGFVSVSRTNPMQTNALTMGEKVGVSAMEIIDGVIYGYDDEGNLFRTCATEDYKRTVIGYHGVELTPDEGDYSYSLQIRDMAWDAKNERMLVLAIEWVTINSNGYISNATKGSSEIYEADLRTGKLTKLTDIVREGDKIDQGVMMLSVDAKGTIYVLSNLNNCISELDLKTGKCTELVSFANLGTSASKRGNLMAMAYDRDYDAIYVSFAKLASCYELYRYDLTTGELVRIGYMGDANIGVYYTTTNVFNGLIVNEEHVCEGDLIGYREPTCCSEGYTGDLYCHKCGHVTKGESIERTEHNYKHKLVTPSCEYMGYMLHECMDCGYTYIDCISPALRHDYESTVTKEPTCTEEGEMTYTCKHEGCNKSYTMPIPKLEHEMTETVVEPTCEGYGYTEHKCEHCDFSYITDLTQPTGHVHTEVVGHKDADCFHEGYTGDLVCSDCGKVLEKGTVIPAGECDCPSTHYKDLSSGAWYHEAVDFVLNMGWMQGYTDGTFAPNGKMTRAEFVQVLYNMYDEEFRPSVDGLEHPFKDVADDFWAHDAIVWAFNEGIVNGMTEDTFDPNGTVTREQIVTILYRLCEEEPVEEDCLAKFSDANRISQYAKEAMNWAVSIGVLEGDGGKLRPRDSVTRAEVATIFMRLTYC